MLGEYLTKEFLMWIVGVFTAAAVAMFGVIYVVDNHLVPQNDSLTTQTIRKK